VTVSNAYFMRKFSGITDSTGFWRLRPQALHCFGVYSRLQSILILELWETGLFDYHG